MENFKKKIKSKIPIWFMRQAGRYLPEYIKLMNDCNKTFFQVVEDFNLSTIITLQPLVRFELDCAIIFSDILYLPRIMGCDIEIIRNLGPKIKPILSNKELVVDNIEEKMKSTTKLIESVRKNVKKDTNIIGFAGGVFTVAAYIVRDTTYNYDKLDSVKNFIYKNKSEFIKIIDKITEATILYLNNQIESGADVVQIFDSLAGDLSEEDFNEFIIKPTKKIISNLKECYVIGFPRGAGEKYIKYVNETGVDAISVDYTAPLDWVLDNLTPITTVQGNLDPYLLAFDINKSIIQTNKILDKLGNEDFIFNLGHGMLKNTPIENIHKVVDIVKRYKK